jgi:DNA repair exonuclease SbcCD ATPase subunit
MKIEKIKIKNFYSFKEVEISFDNYRGLTLIKGKNIDTGGSNGSGKSALVEALYFGLTGKTIRKSTEDALVNNQARKRCKVEVHLTHNNEYIVISRFKKPSKLEFLVGASDKTQESVIATQRYIDSYLNINYKVLLASMFFGQSNEISFLDCTADDKRIIIRNFLNLEDVFEMRDRIKRYKSQFYQASKEKDAIVGENRRTISTLDKKLRTIDEAKDKFSQYDSSTLALSIEDVMEAERTFLSSQQQYMGIQKDLDGVLDKFHTLAEKIATPDLVDVCDKCGQLIEEEFDKEKLEKELKELGVVEAEMKKDLQRVQDRQVPPPITSHEFAQVLEYQKLCKEEGNYLELKEDMASSISQAQKEKDESTIQYEVMRFWEKAFSEHGVLKYVIRNILEYFNERCNFYLSYLTNSKYFIEFDEELQEKIETSGRLIQYISLSGGEKRKFNLAVMLGLKDLLLLSDKAHTDLIFFDEVAENLDEEGVHGLYNLLQEIKQNKTIFVITHNKYLKTLLDSSPRLSIIKKKGLSTLEV